MGKTIKIIIILITTAFLGAGVFLFLTHGPWGNNPNDPDVANREKLESWSDFLHGGDGESRRDEVMRKTAVFLLKADGTYVEGETPELNDERVTRILKEHYPPGEFAFAPKEKFKKRFGDIRDLEKQFSSNRKFLEFLGETDHLIAEIKDDMDRIPTAPAFPETLETLKGCSSPVQGYEVDIDKVYLTSDFERMKNLFDFTDEFQKEAKTFGVEDYRDHFHNSRERSPASVLEHIRTLPDLHEYRFSRSDGEKGLLRLMKLIRRIYPAAER